MTERVVRWTPGLLQRVVRDARRDGALPPSPFGSLDGRQDYRGLPLGPYFLQAPTRDKTVRAWRLHTIDFSEADLNNVAFERCEFEDVVFTRAILGAASEHGCSFTHCVFDHTEMRKAMVGYHGSRYEQCTFVRVRFAGAGFIRPEFNSCVFDRCYMKNLDFDAASFDECAFIGRLDGVVFRNGYLSDSDYSRFGAPRPNRMRHVDFSGAELSLVGFGGGVDLSTVRLPADSSCVLLDRWHQRLTCLRNALDGRAPDNDEAMRYFLGMYDPQPPPPWYKRLLPEGPRKNAAEQNWYILNEAETRGEFGDDVWRSLLEC